MRYNGERGSGVMHEQEIFRGFRLTDGETEKSATARLVVCRLFKTFQKFGLINRKMSFCLNLFSALFQRGQSSFSKISFVVFRRAATAARRWRWRTALSSNFSPRRRRRTLTGTAIAFRLLPYDSSRWRRWSDFFRARSPTATNDFSFWCWRTISRAGIIGSATKRSFGSWSRFGSAWRRWWSLFFIRLRRTARFLRRRTRRWCFCRGFYWP